MGNPQFKITELDDDTVEIGVVSGNESYDSATGQLHNVTRVSRKELEAAMKSSTKERKERESAIDAALKNQEAYPPRFHPNDPRADSSPLSQDRPPIYISSESNPSEANPQPDADLAADAGVARGPDGLAQVPGNTQFEEAPGPNLAGSPKGIKKPTPKKNVPHSQTALGKKEAADAKAARDGGGSRGSANLDAAAARAVKKAADASPTPVEPAKDSDTDEK